MVSAGEGRGGEFLAWATEPVRVVDHDPAWAARATLFAEEVGDLFARWLISDVLHVG